MIPAEIMQERITALSRTLVEQTVTFATNGGFPPGTAYKESHDGAISALVMALAEVIAGTLADPEDTIEIVLKQFRAKHLREFIASKRLVFIKNLADHGKVLQHGKPGPK